MRIIKYTTHFDKERKPILVKEHSSNYPDICKLDNPERIYKMMCSIYNANIITEEYMWAIAVNTKLKPIGIFEISHGTVNASIVTPREIFMKLLLCGATEFILVHNHPSGETQPSKEDIQITKRIKEAGQIMNVKLLDHIIIGKDYYSLSENGFI